MGARVLQEGARSSGRRGLAGAGGAGGSLPPAAPSPAGAGGQGAVWSCVLNEEAVVAATASADFSTRLWNALTGDEVHQFQHSHIARTVAFARRSPRLLSAGTPAARACRAAGLMCAGRCAASRGATARLLVPVCADGADRVHAHVTQFLQPRAAAAQS